MKSLLQRLLKRLFYAGAERPRPVSLSAAPAPAPDWTEMDRRVWAQYLASSSNKLLARMRAVEFTSYQTGCGDCMHPAYNAARARGFTDARAWLESLSRTACVTAEGTASPGEGLNAETDMLRPEGEAELHERFSP